MKSWRAKKITEIFEIYVLIKTYEFIENPPTLEKGIDISFSKN